MLAGVGAGIAVLGSALKAAVEDEAEQKTLATTLRSVAGATTEQIAATEKWIDTTQRATGVADSELRPALDKLVRSSSSVEDAQKNLSIAMDVSRGTGRDLDTVAQALAKVLEGNIGAAARLVPELTGIAKEGATADEAMAALAKTFAGQTNEHANTAAGKMERINVAFGEMKERLGAALLPKLTEFGDWLITTGIPKMEEIATKVKEWWARQDDLKAAIKATVDFIKLEVDGILAVIDAIKQVFNWLDAFERRFAGSGAAGVPGIIGAVRGYAPTVTVGGEVISPDTYGGGRASGGPVMPGMSYKVNERGTEWLQMGNRGGWINPNGPSSGGSQTINLVVDGKVLASVLVDASNDSGGLPIRIRAAS